MVANNTVFVGEDSGTVYGDAGTGAKVWTGVAHAPINNDSKSGGPMPPSGRRRAKAWFSANLRAGLTLTRSVARRISRPGVRTRILNAERPVGPRLELEPIR